MERDSVCRDLALRVWKNHDRDWAAARADLARSRNEAGSHTRPIYEAAIAELDSLRREAEAQ